VPQLSVVIPGYNEAERLPRSLEQVLPWLEQSGKTYEVVLVDDGSQDASLEVMRGWEARHPAIRVVYQKPNRGKGRALAIGVEVTHGDLVLTSDADFSTPIDELPKLEAALAAGADVAIGSRARPGAQIEVPQPLYRVIGGRVLNVAIQALALPGVWDSQCGFKLFKGDLARTVFGELQTDGFAYDVEVLWRARRGGHRIAEVPVVWRHKEDSRVSPFRHSFEILRDVVAMRFRR
jgi:dolichyl-phosphate beta-glucosyltransferase